MSNIDRRERALSRLSNLVAMLGYRDGVNFVSASRPAHDRHANHLVREATDTIGVHGAFVLDDGFRPARQKPIVYIASADDVEELRRLHKEVWSQGAVPFLLVEMPEKVVVCKAFSPPDSASTEVDFTDDQTSLPEELINYSATRISSSLTWRDFDLNRESGVDNKLVIAIEALNDHVRTRHPTLAAERDLVNALIGKFIYIYVLVDRGILSKNWLTDRLIERGEKSALQLVDAIFLGLEAGDRVWSSGDALAVFDVVDEAINGSVFQLEPAQRALLPDEACNLVHRVIRCGEQLFVDGVQLGFFNVSFKVLQTETISAIYERFVSVEGGGDKKHEGVFYTPPHLADHVLNRVEAVAPITESSRFLDPAAGSGIFLVGAFRRLMERNVPEEGWSPSSIGLAKRLLLDCIFGIEKHRQAANVARFSLYLTLLEYVGRAPIEDLMIAAGDTKFLPPLSDNIVCADSFTTPFGQARFTHVVGNPPWTMIGGQKDRTNTGGRVREEGQAIRAFKLELARARLKTGHSRLSDLFTWLAQRCYANSGGLIAFVLPARSVIGRGSSNFAHSLACEVTVRWVGNLSHLRRKLFAGVEASACVVIAENRRPSADDRCQVYRPLISSLPSGERNEVWSLLGSNSEVQTVRSRDFESGPNGWFVQTVLGEMDRRTHEALRDWSRYSEQTLGDFLRNSGLVLSRGFSPKETDFDRARHGDKSVQLQPLSESELASVNEGHRGWYAGNVILLPRKFSGAFYHSKPVAFPSTFNAIIPASQLELARSGPIPSHLLPRFTEAQANAFIAFFDSKMAQYFAALFGASYWMDKARVEKKDLITMPFPFRDLVDDRFLELGNTTSVDVAILDAMEAGAEFRAAFNEFVEFRRHYANAQIPANAFSKVSDEDIGAYCQRLRAEIKAGIGRVDNLSISIERSPSDSMVVGIGLGGRPSASALPNSAPKQFLGNSLVARSTNDEGYLLVKSMTRQAWTLEQAVADASAVFRVIQDRSLADIR